MQESKSEENTNHKVEYMPEKIPIAILTDIQEQTAYSSGQWDVENHRYYFHPHQAHELRRLLNVSGSVKSLYSDEDDFTYRKVNRNQLLKSKNISRIGYNPFTRKSVPNKNNVNNMNRQVLPLKIEDKLNVNVIVGHHSIFKKELGDLFDIEIPISHQKRNQQENPESPGQLLKQEYEKFYNHVFKKKYATELKTDDFIHKDTELANEEVSGGAPRYKPGPLPGPSLSNIYEAKNEGDLVKIEEIQDKPLFEKILFYIFNKHVKNDTSALVPKRFRRSGNISRFAYYEEAHKKFMKNDGKTNRFFDKLMNHKVNESTENIKGKLAVANGSVLLIYRINDELYVKLLFHGFPDKDDYYLDYDFQINFSDKGKKLFQRVLKHNEGIIFVRHEHSFHNGLVNRHILDSPLTSLGIFKCMLINRFLNENMFNIPGVTEKLSVNKNLQGLNLLEQISIKQMTVSPLIRTHTTGLLIFGTKYVTSILGSDTLGGLLNELIHQYKENVSYVDLDTRNNVLTNDRTFRRRTYNFTKTKKKMENENKKRTARGDPRLPAGFARGGARRQRQTKRKRKLKTKKAKKHIKKRRTYKNKK